MKTIEDAVRGLGGVWPPDIGEMEFSQIRGYTSAGRALILVHENGGMLNKEKICTRTEFEECARRLRNEPSWDDAPDWAVAKAQDNDGMWCWYEVVPRPSKATAAFRLSGGKVICAGKGEVIGDWRDTLRLRPEKKKMKNKTETEMLIHMLDYHKVPEETDDGIPYSLWGRVCAYRSMGIEEIRLQMKSEEKKMEDKNDWHAKGELPPVGTVCEVMYDGVWEQTKIIGWDDTKIVFTTPFDDITSYDGAVANSNIFRPLQTERERLIERATRVAKDSRTPGDAVKLLIDAGMLKMPEEKQ